MTTAKETLTAALTGQVKTIKELISQTGLGESTVRENIKKLLAEGTISTDDSVKPVTFFIPEVDAEVETDLDQELPIGINPFGGLTRTLDLLPEIPAPDAEPVLLQDILAAMPKAKKAPINPQPAIDKKVAIMEAAGGSITYAARTWTITDAQGRSEVLTSKEFSEYKGEEILAIFETATEVR